MICVVNDVQKTFRSFWSVSNHFFIHLNGPYILNRFYMNNASVMAIIPNQLF